MNVDLKAIETREQAQCRLLNALAAQNWDLAQCWVDRQPGILHGSDEERAHLVLASFGPLTQAERQPTQGWTWLQRQGLELPTSGEGWTLVMTHLLEHGTPDDLDAWLDATGQRRLPSSLLSYALAHHLPHNLQWWLQRGHACDEMAMGRPWIQFAIHLHKRAATPYVELLLDHGVQPLPWHDEQAPMDIRDTPLLAWVRHYVDQNSPTQMVLPRAEDHLVFRRLWQRLIEAGDRPDQRTIQGDCPLQILAQTPAWEWWQAQTRERHLAQRASVAAGRRLRS